MRRTAIQVGLAAHSCPTRTAMLIMRAAAHGVRHVAHPATSSYNGRTLSTALPSPCSPTLVSSSQQTVAHSLTAVAHPIATTSLSSSLEGGCATEGGLYLSAASSSLTRVARVAHQPLPGRLCGACHRPVRRGAAAAEHYWQTDSSGVAQPRRGRGRQRRGIVAMAKEDLIEPIDVAHSEHQMKLMFEDECILVDENDNVVGHDSKYNCHLMERIDTDNLLHRAFSVFLFNSKNELLLQQRAGTKVTFPLTWTNTCCSHPLYRESELITEKHLGVRNAAQRKLLDELGIKPEQIPVDKFTILGRIHYKALSHGKWGEHEVDYLLVMRRDVDLEANPDEVASVQYVDRAALKEIVRKADAGEDGIILTPWFRLVVDTFLFKWWDRLEEGTLESIIDLDTIHRF